MKRNYCSPKITGQLLWAERFLAVSIGGSTENFPGEYADGGNFEDVYDIGEVEW